MAVRLPGAIVMRAAERGRSGSDGVDSRRCFAFDDVYDAGNVRFGSLVAVNDDRLAAGAGYGMHTHAGVTIVTWVVHGRLAHADSGGHVGVTGPGVVQIFGTGAGSSHSERSAADTDCRFIQSWILDAGESAYFEQTDVTARMRGSGIVPVVELPGARMLAGVLRAGEQAFIPTAPLAHVFVAVGSVTVADVGELFEGDSARLTGATAVAVTAESGGADVLVWLLDD